MYNISERLTIFQLKLNLIFSCTFAGERYIKYQHGKIQPYGCIVILILISCSIDRVWVGVFSCALPAYAAHALQAYAVYASKGRAAKAFTGLTVFI